MSPSSLALCFGLNTVFFFVYCLIGGREAWNWHGEDYGVQKNSNFGKLLPHMLIISSQYI